MVIGLLIFHGGKMSNVSTDLQYQRGPKRALFAKIDGLEPILWQEGFDTPISSWTEDDFNNGVVDLDQSKPTGTITEANDQLIITVPSGTNCNWWDGTDKYAPIAYRAIPQKDATTEMVYTTRISYYSVEGASDNRSGTGLTIWKDRNNFYDLLIKPPDMYWANWRIHYQYCVNNSATSSTNVAVTNPNTAATIFRIKWNPSTNKATFGYSQDEGANYTDIASDVTLSFVPIYLGIFGKNWSGTYNAATFRYDWIKSSVTGDEYWTRSFKKCLIAPESEYSFGLDLATMSVSPPAMDLELIDIADPDDTRKSYFGKLFAPGRYTQNDQHTARVYFYEDDTTYYIDSNATTIKVWGSCSDFDSTGTAHIGNEAFSYTSVGGTFGTVVKGLYPCVGTGQFGKTFALNSKSSKNNSLLVTSVPYSWIGRRIALYVVTWDDFNNRWNNESDAVLLWVGRIGNGMRYNGDKKTWSLGCEHIMKDLDKEICTDLPTAELMGINLSGRIGNEFIVSQWDYGTEYFTGKRSFYNRVTVTAKYYADYNELINEINPLLQDGANWTIEGSHPLLKKCNYLRFYYDESQNRIGIKGNPGGDTAFVFNLRSESTTKLSHVLSALGFTADQVGDMELGGDTYDLIASLPPAISYHAIDPACNGRKLYYNSKSISTGSYTINADNENVMSLMIKGKSKISNNDEDRAYIVDVTSDTHVDHLTHYFTIRNNGTYLTEPITQNDPNANCEDYVSQRMGDSVVEILQIFRPMYNEVKGTYRTAATGPFDMCLFPLLSTGTLAYNDDFYDILPLSFSIGMQSDIVDDASFRKADKQIASSDLKKRTRYFITKPLKYSEMLSRECKLFGYFLSWDIKQGKFTLKQAYNVEHNKSTVTLTDYNSGVPYEFDSIEWSDATVINKWECNVNYDVNTDKYNKPIIIRDVNSIKGLDETEKIVKIEHPGLDMKNDLVSSIYDLLEFQLLSTREMTQFPCYVLTRTLSPTLLTQVAIGDVVLVTCNTLPDPFGSGDIGFSAYGIITNLSWNLSTYEGKATIIIYGQYKAEEIFGYYGGATCATGFTTGKITVDPYVYGSITDMKDGYRFLPGYSVKLIERAPADINNPQILGPFAVTKTFETDGTNILTIDTSSIPAWDATKEYIVVPDNYSNAASNQILSGTWMSNANLMLSSTKVSFRLGI